MDECMSLVDDRVYYTKSHA